MPPVNLEQLKALVASGPPIEPNAEHPGPLMQAMIRAEQALTKVNGKCSAEDLVGALVTILDHNRWENELRGYQNLAKVLEAAESKIAVVPAGVVPQQPPPRLVKP
jgi:hypothetical protein